MSSTKTKRLDEPSTILCHRSSSDRNYKISHDIAPVHVTAGQRLLHVSESSVSAMESKQKSAKVDASSGSTLIMPDGLSAPSTSVIHQKNQQAGISEVTSDLRDKLNLRNTNGVMNGIRMGTTDVEVHYSGVATSTTNTTTHSAAHLTSFAAIGSNSISVRSKITPSPLTNIANTTLFRNYNKANEIPLSPPHEPPPPPPSFRDIPPLSPPHEPPPPPPCEEPGGYQYIKSVASRAIGADSPCSSKSSHDGGTGVCNGHTVSEATSNTSIAASSEFSISSERSTDSSYSGARARTRHTSNSSSQSTQPRSDLDLSVASDAVLKTPEISVSPLPNSEDYLPVEYVNYENETQMASIMSLIQKDLSEPYSIYTYRYFIHNWPHLCFLALVNKEVIGAVVCKLDMHKKGTVRGYIAMLAVDQRYRKRKIGSNLVQQAMRAMAADDADEVVLETEITNQPALRLYQALGFVRDKRLFRYYLNGVDALRLKLWLR
uniref:N-terminal methionine N(alpha)-acetyltransferase NatC n=1 Tax=Hirondellea gigas TaxID=1518452 RepID=A0A2P2IA00_9CRUS